MQRKLLGTNSVDFDAADQLLIIYSAFLKSKGKAVPLQARRGPEVSRKLWFPDFVTTAQDGDRCALRTGRLYPQEILTPGTHFC